MVFNLNNYPSNLIITLEQLISIQFLLCVLYNSSYLYILEDTQFLYYPFYIIINKIGSLHLLFISLLKIHITW